jgi:hypothetical protein
LLAYISNILLIIYALQVPFPHWMVWPVGALGLVLGVLGMWLGLGIGKKITGLIG